MLLDFSINVSLKSTFWEFPKKFSPNGFSHNLQSIQFKHFNDFLSCCLALDRLKDLQID